MPIEVDAVFGMKLMRPVPVMLSVPPARLIPSDVNASVFEPQAKLLSILMVAVPASMVKPVVAVVALLKVISELEVVIPAPKLVVPVSVIEASPLPVSVPLTVRVPPEGDCMVTGS